MDVEILTDFVTVQSCKWGFVEMFVRSNLIRLSAELQAIPPKSTFPKGEGFWIRLVRLTCRGCWGRQRPDFLSYAATCAPRAGAFLRQGACDQSKKGFLTDFTTRRFVPVYSASFYLE